MNGRLSWRETATVFQTSWESVYRSVEWFVEWGLAHRLLDGVRSLGVDEIHWGHGMKANNFMTVVYQIDAGCRRLLWIGQRRTEKTLRLGLQALGPEVVQGLRFVCSDMWKPYLNVLATEAGQALHVLDRFHITQHMNQAVDHVRRAESTRLRDKGKDEAKRLKNMRWPLLRKGGRVRGKARNRTTNPCWPVPANIAEMENCRMSGWTQWRAPKATPHPFAPRMALPRCIVRRIPSTRPQCADSVRRKASGCNRQTTPSAAIVGVYLGVH
jgi:hypothetical protein